MELKGVDVSKHQGTINWNTMKSAGVDFAIIRAGYGKLTSQKDPTFDTNYDNAKSVEIPVGAYWYSYATSVDEAKEEAQACLEVIKGKQFEYPICYDIEDKCQAGFSKDDLTDIIIAFGDALENAGYHVALYASYNWLTTKIDMGRASRFDVWIARYNSVHGYTGQGDVCMWQYSSSGTGSEYGVSSNNIDLDVSYKDYPSLIKAEGRNGYSAQSVAKTQAAPSNAFGVGSYIIFSTCYKSPTDTNFCNPVDLNARNHGLITQIVGGRNKYRVDDGWCYVNDGDIREAFDGNISARQNHETGETIQFSTCYDDCDSDEYKSPKTNKGLITSVVIGARNPYCVDDGRCWVNDGDIRRVISK